MLNQSIFKQNLIMNVKHYSKTLIDISFALNMHSWYFQTKYFRLNQVS